MNLDDLQRHWDAFGRQDPLWAILTDPARKGGRWNVDEFFATGVVEVDALMTYARSLSLPASRRRGLDFGCGVGRLTQALAAHVDTALGLDVAPSMVAQANTFNRHPDCVSYRVQAAPPLDGIADRSVDVVITGRVLQHIAPEYSRQYIRELARVLARGGFLSFDVPSRVRDTPLMPDGAMAPSSYRAAIVATPRPAGEGLVAFELAVTNASDVAWASGLPINIGVHWLDADAAVRVFDGPRVAVPLPLAPGQTAHLVMDLARPEDPDATVVEFDAVHEGVAWFAGLGSATTRVDTAPSGRAPRRPEPPAPAPVAAGDLEPVMEMHAVPRPEVEQILAESGVRLLAVRAELHCGPQWEAWRYDVTAP